MKGLLHSKRFRKNLSKWLFMYIGTMLLFTTVITYSKYISSMMSSDGARVAKFDVSVVSDKCSSTENGSLECNTGKYRPTQEIKYYFTLKANVEVKTDIYLTVFLNNSFKMISVKEVGNATPESIVCNTGDVSDRTIAGYTRCKFKAKEFALDQEQKERKYEVTVKFDNTYCSNKESEYYCNQNKDPEDYKSVTNDLYNILRVDYAATQVKN